MYFGIFLECVIMGKRGRSEKYFISCAVSGSKIFLALRNLRYEQTVSLSERSLQRSEFEKAAHAFSRFLRG